LGAAAQKYPVGSLVRARERDWIVLPSEDGEVLRVKPVTGSDDASVGLFLPLEQGDLKSTSFSPPSPEVVGDPTASRILFDAARLLLRSSAAPFRCAGRLSFNPRPYQFVPLIMALRLDPVRVLPISPARSAPDARRPFGRVPGRSAFFERQDGASPCKRDIFPGRRTHRRTIALV